MRAIIKMLIICEAIFFVNLNVYSRDFAPGIKNKYEYDLEEAHYYYHYKNGANYKKYNKPEIEEKRPEGEKIRERYNDRIDFNRDIDRLNNINIEKGNEIKMKFRNEKNIHLDYDH